MTAACTLTKRADPFDSHANWLRSLRADYDKRVSAASADTGSTESELDASWLDGALGDIAADEGINVYIEDEFEVPVYRSFASLAVAVPEDTDVHYDPPTQCCPETGQPQLAAGLAEPRFSACGGDAHALEASWLSENPPLLCRQSALSANSDVALNRALPGSVTADQLQIPPRPGPRSA